MKPKSVYWIYLVLLLIFMLTTMFVSTLSYLEIIQLVLGISLVIAFIINIIANSVIKKHIRKYASEDLDTQQALKEVRFIKKITFNPNYLQVLLANEATLLCDIGHYDEVIRLLSFDIDRSKNILFKIRCYINLGTAYFSIDKMKEAERYLKKAEFLCNEYENEIPLKEIRPAITLNKALLKISKQKSDKELKLLIEDISNIEIISKRMSTDINLLLAKYYIMIKEYKIAKKHIDFVITISKHLQKLEEANKLKKELSHRKRK